jgi:KAP family P-loop domain
MAAKAALGPLQDRLIEAFKPYINPSAPGLMAVLRRSLDYAEVNEKERVVIVDRNAFLLALVSVGGDAATASNASRWFTLWLHSRLEPPLIASRLRAAQTSSPLLAKAQANSFKVIPSASMRKLLPVAVGYATATMGRTSAALRHLFVAVATDPDHVLEIPGLGWTLSSDDQPRLVSHLKGQIGISPDPHEDVEKWTAILNGIHAAPASGAAAKPSIRMPTPAYLLSDFAADRTRDGGAEDIDASPPDPLGTHADVQAMARLICHEDADPPISIGIFGGWGSGKSTFMERLQAEVARLSSNAPAARSGPRFVSPVVQIRFNAWQFADADLWASLTAEFFDQLRAGGFNGKGPKIHDRLVEDVNQHVRGLSKEAADSRAALSKADEKLRKATVDRAQAVAAQAGNLGQAAIGALVDAYQRNRGSLLRLGVLEDNAGGELDRFVAIAREANSQWGQAKLIGRTLKTHWVVASLATAIVAGSAIAVYYSWNALPVFITAAAAALPLVAGLLRTTRTIIDQLSPLAARLGEADEAGLDAVLREELKLRAAENEAEAMRETAARADRALARYVDPAAPSNPPRLLRYLLEDDPETKALQKEIGMMGRARRLFEALDQIIQDRKKARDIPARIILYIDDLDRCTHDQVYRVLQAVHLLLAFRLFVVIVAVDVKWVEGAVQKHLEIVGGAQDSKDEETEDKRQRSIDYLSKIFQLPFWLKPFSGRDDTRFAAYVESLTGPGMISATRRFPPGTDPALADSSEGDSTLPMRHGAGSASSGTGAAAGSAGKDPKTVAKARTHRNALKTMQLDRIEIEFLAGKEIAAVASSDPRGVKRLVNVYKIARSRLSEVDDGMIFGDERIAPAYPLIALIAAIETGQPYAVADSLYDLLKTEGIEEELISDKEYLLPAQLRPAIKAAIAERGGLDVTIAEMLEIARIVRRYSFNKYH